MTEPERINFLINILEGGNATAFGEKIGISKAQISKIRRGICGMKPHINTILAIYPNVNRDWLISGEGHPGDLTIDLVRSYYETKLRRADSIIDHLTRRIEDLENRLK